ncbi:hypothetical protein Z517_01283 [Fonsecaea pedrosoi CBS 271.37]|uniref:Uncharacterized protein n=1 Tax=Fonsecaea pedrosoi CBS 271.37 TaxID=1442368 RepID=A0A0D2H4U1_9EURO|nr:uncharacterized protein Z517_01283 [Fonsecaea pedrosoi CBS 271.37]KIW85890.1 hypothetical protein Z517_01283 [Fonsecaea pedrosoi CBS 271.37]
MTRSGGMCLPWILPWQKNMTLDPIQKLVTAAKDDDRRQLTRNWRESKLAELNYVGLTSALVTSAFASAIGWQTVNLIPYVLGIWFGGLILVLTSIFIATAQSIAVYRLTTSDEGLDELAGLLGNNPQDPGSSQPRRFQVLAWQMPVMLLNLSITLFLIGLLCQIFNSYTMTRKDVKVGSDPQSGGLCDSGSESKLIELILM